MKSVAKYIVLPALLSSMPILAMAHDDSSEDKNKQEYSVKLYPLNQSGVSGKVEISLKGNNRLKISLEAEGLEPGRPHPQHIHGLNDLSLNATCPGIEADIDGDGLISVGEGFPFYGPIVLPLTPFDLVERDGELEYEAKFSINPESIQPLDKRTIVLHGMTVNGVYIASLPIACGIIELEDD